VAKSYEVQIDGLKDVQKALKAVDKTAPKALRVGLNEVAGFVIKKALPLVPSRTGAARRSWKARSTRTESRISYGGPKAPYAPWLDFGGRVGKKKSVVRPFIKEGRYLYPTVKKHRTDIQAIGQEKLTEALREAGLDVD
jgi:hypothetical protein